MDINYNYIIEKLEANISIFKGLLQNISSDQASWRPSSEKWSLLEVTNHLYDEEREDFRQRLTNVLEDPRKPWPSIDPKKWIIDKEYNKREMNSSLNNFLIERRKSIEWLKNLTSPDWKASYNHSKLGEISSEMLLANWLAHDYLHIRQITFLLWSYLAYQAHNISLDYAGEW